MGFEVEGRGGIPADSCPDWLGKGALSPGEGALEKDTAKLVTDF